MNRALTTLCRIETNDKNLTRLHIWSLRELRYFINAVQENSNIRTLIIHDTVLAPDIATALSAIFPRMPFLSRFDMANCDCSNADGLSILASALASRNSLESLCLYRCRIETRGTEIIASSLGDNTALRSLSLSGNSIGEPNIHFKRVLYNDASIESVIASNHTLLGIFPQTVDLQSFLELNKSGPEKALRSKIIRFLNEQPIYVLSMGLEVNVMTCYMEKIGRDCRLNTMFELIRNLPGVLEGRRKRPYQQCRKRSRY